MYDRIKIIHDDLLKQEVDVIVNAANTHLEHMGGIAGIISSAAGPDVQKQSRQKRPVATGAAVETTAGALPFMGIVHAVGPIWGGGDFEEDTLLRRAHMSAVRVAARCGATSIAFPAISCGIFGFPVERAAPIAIEAVADALNPHRQKKGESEITEVRFCLVHPEHLAAFRDALDRRAPKRAEYHPV